MTSYLLVFVSGRLIVKIPSEFAKQLSLCDIILLLKLLNLTNIKVELDTALVSELKRGTF